MKTILTVLFIATVLSLWSLISLAADTSPKVLTDDDKRNATEQVLTILGKHYVYPSVAQKMREFVTGQYADGEYDDVTSSKELIEKLQADLRSISKDGHLSLELATESNDLLSVVRPDSSEDTQIRYSVVDRQSEKSIGYLGFNRFIGDDETKKNLINAMAELANTDALIIDLRDNLGGDPNAVAFLSSYFLDQDIMLWSIIDRDSNSVLDVQSSNSIYRYAGYVCILTSRKTYSAAEAFSYTLKHLDRACIVGENTGGGAHLVDMMRVNDEIDIRMPVVRAYNPITKSNWEGVGVVPTLKTPATNADKAAIKYLKNKLNN